MLFLRVIWAVVRVLISKKADLVAENLALRQQLIVLRRRTGRPRLLKQDRIFWLWLARSWSRWRDSLIVVKPGTVVRWHRRGFRYYWTWKSRHKCGRPTVTPEVLELIRRMSRSNPLWGTPRIHGELLKLGIDISQASVGKYMIRARKPPSLTWRAFLDNHVKDLISIDFFTVPTIAFRVLFVFLVLSHDRRRVLHFNVTEHPGAEWTGRQLIETFPWDTAPRYMIRDRRRVLRGYLHYYHRSRTHLALDKDPPQPRPVEPPTLGRVVEFPEVGGLHHRYSRQAA